MSQEQQRKLELCPLTNSNCEGEFAQLDNAIRRVGGTVSIQTLSIQTLSNRKLVASNRLFSSDKWTKTEVPLVKKQCTGQESEDYRKGVHGQIESCR